jgi:hypothetical protein
LKLFFIIKLFGDININTLFFLQTQLKLFSRYGMNTTIYTD